MSEPQLSAFGASGKDNPLHRNLLVFATGSVATVKLPLLVDLLLQRPLNVQVIVTPTAERFLSPQELQSIASKVHIWRNDDEWAFRWTRGDPVLHIELRKWADMMLIAPLSANSLAAIASGLSNGLGLSIIRAWDTTGFVGDRSPGTLGQQQLEVTDGVGSQNKPKKKILVAPAMNTQMYIHPLTDQQLSILETWGWFKILKPVEKMLACGDIGVGGMMEVEQIVDNVSQELDAETK